MKLYIEVEIDNVENTEEVIELLDVVFEDQYGNTSWVATELYNENDNIAPEIKGFNIFTDLKGILKNTITGNSIVGEYNE